MNWRKCTTQSGLHDFESEHVPCKYCGLYQSDLWKTPAEKTQSALEKAADKKPAENIYSSLQATAVELAEKFGEPNKVGRYIGVVRRLGESKARMLAGDVLSDPNAKSPAKLFFYKVKQL